MTKQELREKAASLPLQPGVYLMKNSEDAVIYVGKAKKLKNRVSQYFQEKNDHNFKTRIMVGQVDHFDTIVASSEFEALVLENALIKQHMPRYNILLKDDKGYPFVRLSGGEYPRFSMVSRPAEDGARYFGPYGGRQETRGAIDALLAALHLPTCSRVFPRDIEKERPCLNFHMGRCDGFCRREMSGEEYRRRIEQAVLVLEGKQRQLLRQIRQEMEELAENLQFEQAAVLRDRVKAIESLSKRQKVIAGVCADTDIWGIYRGDAKCAYAVLHFEQGQLTGKEAEVFAPPVEDSAEAMLSPIVAQYYAGKGILPREILLPCQLEDMEELAEFFSEKAGRKVALRRPQRGEKAELLDMALRNALEEAERVTTAEERSNRALELLGEMMKLPQPPRRMESYDISNTGASDIVASMVVYQDGKPLKRDYRRFQIKSIQAPDDYASMQEVLTRRLERYLAGDEKFSPLPDVLLIDGGSTHAAAVEQVLQKLGISLPVFGMVKDDRHRTRGLITAQGEEIGLQTKQAAFSLIGQIQEETHRFAVSYHHQRHQKTAKRSLLDGVPGLGPKRQEALRKKFGSIKAMRQATVEELSAVVPEQVARALQEKLKGTKE